MLLLIRKSEGRTTESVSFGLLRCIERRTFWLVQLCLVLLAPFVSAGPLDFGLGEVNASFAERKLKWKVKTDLSMDPPESFRIEPYAYGGAHITGGDLRGLMYGLLEAAEQMRTNGRMARTHGKAATPLRGVRVSVTPDLENAPDDLWRSYFQRLARNRFNRAHVIVHRVKAPFTLERRLSQIAADYAVDLTLGFENPVELEDIKSLLNASPLIRSLAVAPDSPSLDAVMEASRGVGRRVTVDLDGPAHLDESQVPVLRPQAAWPPSFEMTAPFDVKDSEQHETYFWVWGRFGYDPLIRLPKGADASVYAAAREAVLWISASAQSRGKGSEYIASPSEARNWKNGSDSTAKLMPWELADRLDSVAERIAATGSASVPKDLTLVADSAHRTAADLRGDYGESENADASSTPRMDRSASPKLIHLPPGSSPADQTLTLRLQISATAPVMKNLTTVRLHYRFLDPMAEETVLEAPANTDVSFTIPAAELTGLWDLQYYFEVVNRPRTGWFEPDPVSGAPLLVVKIIPSRTGPN